MLNSKEMNVFPVYFQLCYMLTVCAIYTFNIGAHQRKVRLLLIR